MKKLFAIFFCCLLILTGCGKTQTISPNIGTDAPIPVDPTGELDFSDLEVIQTVPGSSTAPSQPAGTGSEASSEPVSGIGPTAPAAEATIASTPATVPTVEPTKPATESTEPSVETTAPSTEATDPVGTTAPATDPEGYFNQVVRP